ncbi:MULTISPECIES: osmotically-inducible lipoprotein OsmE [Pseudomonas]|jgi:osmotically inducible lipoprotein OsmE|uniref:Osmotically-inducible lipoprotein OsmE n=1 Tax=Pseudomonas monachiensis TaxID=3060212 RepID=A0ABW9HE36_9PSED|nr:MULTISPECIES: osmotically-inducible lipoprotein OsmE [unclassified Pseudomonas]KRB01899.1 cell envelope protein SmpA [Pseudomonas sp. Root68]KRB69882.1 cell envelope protein SmpA [Pseudomonas sp. Root71]
MNRPLFTLVVVLTALAGCSTNSIYQDQPLVAKVDTGMTQEQVRQIGGQPLTVSDRTAEPGTCFDYRLTQSGHQQAFNVSFDGRGMVDHKSFMTCAQWSNTQLKAREPSRAGGGGGY